MRAAFKVVGGPFDFENFCKLKSTLELAGRDYLPIHQQEDIEIFKEDMELNSMFNLADLD